MRSAFIFLLFGHFLPAMRAEVPKSPMFATEWKSLPPYPIQVSEAQGAILPGGKTTPADLIVMGGARAFSGWRPVRDVYGLSITEANAQWRRLADLPDDITHQGHAVVGDVLYLCGGYLGRTGHSINECYGYNHTEDVFFSIPSLPERRAGGGLVYIKRRNALLYAGGALRAVARIRDEKDFDDVWMLELGDLGKGWVKKAGIPNPRNHMTAVSVRDRHFFVGGQKGDDESRGNQHSNQEYDVEADAWVERAPLPLKLGHAMASTNAFRNGFVMVGGSTRGLRLLDHVLYYHVGSDTWHFMGMYPRLAKSSVCGIRWKRLLCTVGQASKGKRWDDGYEVRLSELKKVTDFMT